MTTLSKHVSMLSEDGPAMHQVCCRIAARRAAEAKVLPAPEDHVQPSDLKRPGVNWDRLTDLLIILILLIVIALIYRP